MANVIISATSATAVGFDAYGKRYGDAATDPWGYGAQWGYYTDNETGLILCTHRYYDPNTGRWLTRDPIGYDGGVNLYGYVGGDPVNAVDPEGLASRMEIPADIAYQHAYIYFPKKNCLGTDVIGFHLGIPKAWYALQITRTGYPYAKGVVKAPDPSGRDKNTNKLRGRPIATNNDPAFEKALCECIKTSKDNPPQYGPYSVCGSWVDRMWECAKKKLGWS